MLKRVLVLLAACFYYSGLVRLARWWRERQGQCLVVLNYHRATGGDFRRHLLYLRQHYRILHLEAALEELYAPHKEKSSYRYDRILLALTFDDGYFDNYSHCFAIARELEIPFTIFLIPGYVESGDYFWWGEGKRLVSRAQVNEVTIEGHVYHLNQLEERKELAQAIDHRLRHATSVAERETFLESVRRALAVPLFKLASEKPALPLKWTEIQEMDKSKWVSFGAHTMHHPILSYLTDPAEVKHEVGECRAVIELQLGHPVRTFAYPVGQPQHIGDDIVRSVEHAGYDWALTTMYGFNTSQSNPYLLRRIEVDVNQHWLVIAAETAGLWGFFTRLKWIPIIRKYLRNRGSI